MPTTAWTLAIDFGTSNSAAAHSGATSGGIETLSLTHTSNLMPSSVYVAAPDRIFVGDAAVDQAQQNPAGFVASPKRLIGADPFCTVNGFRFPTYVLVAAVLGSIIGRACSAHAGQPPSQLVLTHPEAWAPQQVRVLVDAAAHAGVDPATITAVSEPRAAAAHYSRSHAMQPGARIAVFDFGGGTLDVAVLTVADDKTFRVVAARGDNGLGGKNLDALVQRWVEERLADRDPDLMTYLGRDAPVDVRQALGDSIRRAKELLSEAPSATITVPTPAGRQTLQITRDEFDELIARTVDQALSLTRATLLDAGITDPGQLSALYLTGGSSRIPLIQRRLTEIGPVATLDDPKTVVAQGALLTVRSDRGTAALPDRGDLAVGRPEQAAVTPRFDAPPAPSSRRPRGRIALVAVALVAVVGVIIGVVALLGRDPNPPADAAGASTSAAAATMITDEQQLMAALPASLREAINCLSGSTELDGPLRLSCRVAEDSSLVALGTRPEALFVFVSVDQTKAKSEIVNIRNGTYSNGKGVLVEDSERISAADIYQTTATAESYQLRYANTSTGLMVTVMGLKSVDDAKTFLTRSGLIP